MSSKSLLLVDPDVAKERAQPMDMYVPQQDDDWTSDAYERLNGSRRPRELCGDWPSHRVLTACFSSLLIALGTALCVLVAVWKEHPAALPFCKGCTTILFVAVGLGLFVFVLGVIGALSVWRQTKPLSMCFSLLLAVVTLAVFAAGVMAVLVQKVVISPNDAMRHLWQDAVAHDPYMVCDVQEVLQCSGYRPTQCCVSNATRTTTMSALPPVAMNLQRDAEPCYLVGADGETTLDPKTLQPVTWPREYCAATCNASNIYNNTCEAPLQEQLKSVLPPAIWILFALGAVLLLFSGLAVYRVCGVRKGRSRVRYEY
ncbi:hypothetical protein DQ04_00331080 [Trypanosoma grayi]|uniref:hypothetical protein n=1 Tax=Trypanosoma grayi TaxID=71804 RepID=UPI0004F4953F|nr:hypothetical protein DQ04_00331080 [Trypanosoma grayi]KEG14715.1 hypothetical protein DQ04_00331080 [Trypanosoma grayi]